MAILAGFGLAFSHIPLNSLKKMLTPTGPTTPIHSSTEVSSLRLGAMFASTRANTSRWELLFDPLERTRQLEGIASRGNLRRYYRFRPAKWYGGIVTGDVCCCNLLCHFCWAGDDIRAHPEKVGDYYSPEHAFRILMSIANKRGYRQMRLSGQEPTIGREHLLALLKLVDTTECTFILETNGILIGAEPSYAEELAKFRNLRVRVSLKGTNEDEFSGLTGAVPDGFKLKLQALRNLIGAGARCHPAVMASFSPPGNRRKLEARLGAIDASLAKELEIEELILYPHVARRLKMLGLAWGDAHAPDNVPDRLV